MTIPYDLAPAADQIGKLADAVSSVTQPRARAGRSRCCSTT